MDNNGQKWTKMDKNGQKWTKMDKNGQKCQFLPGFKPAAFKTAKSDEILSKALPLSHVNPSA